MKTNKSFILDDMAKMCNSFDYPGDEVKSFFFYWLWSLDYSKQQSEEKQRLWSWWSVIFSIRLTELTLWMCCENSGVSWYCVFLVTSIHPLAFGLGVPKVQFLRLIPTPQMFQLKNWIETWTFGNDLYKYGSDGFKVLIINMLDCAYLGKYKYRLKM